MFPRLQAVSAPALLQITLMAVLLAPVLGELWKGAGVSFHNGFTEHFSVRDV